MKAQILIAALFLSVQAVFAGQNTGSSQTLPMPPAFSSNTDIEEALRNYPLGMITKLAAFSHHGKADENVTLVNGLEGWVFEIHEGGSTHTFSREDGTKVESRDDYNHPETATFTLVFGEEGKIIDVLYQDASFPVRKSALLEQRAIKGDRESGESYPPTK